MSEPPLDRQKTAAAVRAGGAALFGERWVQPLAFALRRKTAEVRDWAEALRPAPVAALLDLRALLIVRWDKPEFEDVRAAVRLIDALL